MYNTINKLFVMLYNQQIVLDIKFSASPRSCLWVWLLLLSTKTCSCSAVADGLESPTKAVERRTKPVNILLMLADDLGYGDTSVFPFVGTGVFTPELERMASRGTIMNNFHSAAATCTPTRASILTGLYPWRLGIKAVYEYGIKGKSNRDDWLPQVPTVAMAFRSANYFTGHSGKWHIGGMRNDDLDMRLLPKYQPFNSSDFGRTKKCQHPGPNQQGFDEYVSVLDGPGSPRQNDLQVNENLHSQGCNHLLHNDILIGRNGSSKKEFLSDCEARHAIRMIENAVEANRPFYIHLWFHAPHGPWEELSGFKNFYPDQKRLPANQLPMCASNRTVRYCAMGSPKRRRFHDRGVSLTSKYRTMVTAMDRSIGAVLSRIRSLGIERDTLVVFTSDNGPEDIAGRGDSGTPGLFKGYKRYLYEGGLRVPTIWQWVGTIPRGRNISTLGVSTDFYPTFLDAAGIAKPPNVQLDGSSLLPILTGQQTVMKKQKQRAKRKLEERVVMWHGEYEGPRSSAMWLYDFKVMLNASDLPSEMYDMRTDKYETNNLLANYTNSTGDDYLNMRLEAEQRQNMRNMLLLGSASLNRSDPLLHFYIVSRTFSMLSDYAQKANGAYLIYLEENPGRNYTPTVESDTRWIRSNVYKHISQKKAAVIRAALHNSTCSSICSCDVPQISTVPSFPFDKMPSYLYRINPGRVCNASTILRL